MLFGLIIRGLFTNEVQDFDTKPDPNPVKGHEWRAFRREANPMFDPATEKLGPETFDVQPSEIIASRAVVVLTQVELDGIDENKIRAGLLEMGFLLTELANVLLAKNVIVSGDFSAKTKQDYLAFKALVGKLRP